MPGTWDDLMKMLIRANSQDFLSFIFEGARCQEDVTHELFIAQNRHLLLALLALAINCVQYGP